MSFPRKRLPRIWGSFAEAQAGSHLMVQVEPFLQHSPPAGYRNGGWVTIDDWRAAMGLAVVVGAARARAERSAVNNCIAVSSMRCEGRSNGLGETDGEPGLHVKSFYREDDRPTWVRRGKTEAPSKSWSLGRTRAIPQTICLEEKPLINDSLRVCWSHPCCDSCTVAQAL
jgi:hypothetical protein